MIPALIVLYVLSAALPITGLLRLHIITRTEAAAIRAGLAGASTQSRISVTTGIGPLVEGLLKRPRAVLLDLGFIGAGVVAGAIAGVLSLFAGDYAGR